MLSSSEGGEGFPFWAEYETALMSIGFFDDSGKESTKDDPYVCIAGFLAHRSIWGGFLRQWAHMLSYHQLSEFHTNEVMSERFLKQRGWGWEERGNMISDFTGLIAAARLTGFGVGIDANWWKALPAERRKMFGRADEFAFERILRLMADRLDLIKSPDVVEVYFDNDVGFSGGRLNRFNHIRKQFVGARRRFVCISFAEASSYGALQAADLLAWQTHSSLVRRSRNKSDTPSYKALEALMPMSSLGPYKGEFWDADTGDSDLQSVEDWYRANRSS